ncbi:MAG TPA: hypothetical protein PKA66_03465 [Gemmatimonadales bacterium]|nr:hypothetical protein [Gemmatimonadales bacterium]
MTDRRYSEDEIARIFKQAAEAQQTARRQLPSGEGMTLTDLQEIGREVGIPPALVAQAARGLDRAGSPAGRRFLGLPLGVGRTVELGRRLTDEEWDQLVVDLRETFHARGTVRRDGSLRQWTNGNLQALLEPTATGDRLRLRTMNGNARGLMFGGLAIVGIALVPAMSAAFETGLGAALSGLVPMLFAGAVLFAVGALRLPRWAKNRARQMEEVAARLVLQTEERKVPPTPIGPGS